MRALAAIALGLVLCAAALAQPLPGKAGAPAKSTSPADRDLKQVQPTRGDDKDVIEASQRFLKLIDGGHYGTAWDGAAAPLKSSVTRENFIAGLGKFRKPLGTVASRKAGQFARAHQMPGGPEGDYALVSFDTKFTSGKSAEEQVVWLLDENDWRVSGYFIR